MSHIFLLASLAGVVVTEIISMAEIGSVHNSLFLSEFPAWQYPHYTYVNF